MFIFNIILIIFKFFKINQKIAFNVIPSYIFEDIFMDYNIISQTNIINLFDFESIWVIYRGLFSEFNNLPKSRIIIE